MICHFVKEGVLRIMRLSSKACIRTFIAFMLFLLVPAHQVSAEGVDSVSPSSVASGSSGVSISINLTSGQPLPPDNVMPISVTIGKVEGKNISRNNQVITAEFDFSTAETGSYDVSVTFPKPDGSLVLTLGGGITITGSSSVETDGGGATQPSGNASSEPTPSITANGMDGSLTVASGETLSVSISLSAGNSQYSSADWWVLKNSESGWYYYSLAGGWQSGMNFTFQGPLFDLPYFEIENISSQEDGTTTYYFGLGMPASGILGGGAMKYDYVSVTKSTEQETPTNNESCNISETTIRMNITDTMLVKCYDSKGDEMSCPSEGQMFYGQDGNYMRLTPDYTLFCSDAVVVDNQTGLMWEKAHHDERINYAAAQSYCDALDLGGYDDWRIPTIKELLSISEWHGSQNVDGAFYLDKTKFDFDYPTINSSELTGTHSNQMMGQTWSSTHRPDLSDNVYFYNFLDAHIKSQSTTNPDSTLFYRCVRGKEGGYENNLVDNNDQTVTDNATGLMWMKQNGEQSDGDYQFTWAEALDYCENLTLAGYSDWRLPDVKELQSIVDYDPPDWEGAHMVLDTTFFDFILPSGKDLFTPPTTSPPEGASIAPFFWTSTTHGDGTMFAAYVCFGPCWAVEDQGMNSDVHGPGAQRSDPKDEQMGNVWNMIGESIGDQKDTVQVNDFVRCVRN